MASEKKSCLVLVGNVPSTFSAEDLRQNLKAQAQQVMVAVVLSQEDTERLKLESIPVGTTYGLVKFSSEEHALAAAKQGIYIGDDRTKFFTLQAIRPDQALEVGTASLRKTIRVEGKDYRLEDFSQTRGYQNVFFGKSVPKLCTSTRNEEDCPLGSQCHFLHLNAFQRTTMRRRVLQLESDIESELLQMPEEGGRSAGRKRNRPDEGEDEFPQGEERSQFEQLLGLGAEESLQDFLPALLPQSLLVPDQQLIPIGDAEIESIFLATAGGHQEGELKNSTAFDAVAKKIRQAAAETKAEAVFVKLNLPHSAPTDIGIARVDELRRRCPLPSELPTPERRDRYIVRVWNQTLGGMLRLPLNSKSSSNQKNTDDDDDVGTRALKLLQQSEKVKLALDTRRKNGFGKDAVKIVVQPFLEQNLPAGSSSSAVTTSAISSSTSFPFREVQMYFLRGQMYTCVQRLHFLSYFGVSAKGKEDTEAKKVLAKIEGAAEDVVQQLETHFSILSNSEKSTKGNVGHQKAFCLNVVFRPTLTSQDGVGGLDFEGKVVSIHSFEEAATNNILFPSEPPTQTNETTEIVRFRDERTCQTTFLPHLWQKLIAEKQ